MINQVLSTVWFSMQFYLPRGQRGGIERDWSESASSQLVAAHTYPCVLQLWFDVLIVILVKPLLEADMGLDPRGKTRTVDEWNTWTLWRHHPGFALIPHGDYEPLCRICLGLLSKYLLSKYKISKDIEGMMVTSFHPNFNSQGGLLRYHACCMVYQF